MRGRVDWPSVVAWRWRMRHGPHACGVWLAHAWETTAARVLMQGRRVKVGRERGWQRSSNNRGSEFNFTQ